MSKNQRTNYHCGASPRDFLELSAYPDEHKVYISVTSNCDEVRLDSANARRLAKAILECVGEGPKLETTGQALDELRARLKAPPYNACGLADRLLDMCAERINLDEPPNCNFGGFAYRVPGNILLSKLRLHEAADVMDFLKKHGIRPDSEKPYAIQLSNGIRELVNKVMPELAEDD